VKNALCWLRRDLRLKDNSALALATATADRVAVVFVFDTNILDDLIERADSRVSFILDSAMEIDRKLQELGSRLIILHGDPKILVPKLAKDLEVDAVFSSHDDDPYAISRDAMVRKALSGMNVEWHSCKDHVVFERQEVVSKRGEPFIVFTPYMNAWKAMLDDIHISERVPILNHIWNSSTFGPQVTCLTDIGFETKSPWVPAGETAAQSRLLSFADQMDDYSQNRDRPDLMGTSHLSVDLRHGTISVRQCVREARKYANNGSTKWLDEVIWRDFYHMILANSPIIVSEPFKAEFRSVEWPGDLEDYEKWEQGQTGYPIVDAAMRCLNETGWMHNRLRMIAAMFMTKDLLLDYRLGESYFARKLLDFELASNNGGWQWCASTGVDAQPWFRIFNPVTQSKKCDPFGVFIRTWCPELNSLDNEQIHWPHKMTMFEQMSSSIKIGVDYPHPMVDHQVQRTKALEFFSMISRKS